jgi:cytochrome d ubiquinol oxidase subunit II
MSTIAGVILWLGVTCYAVFGGADYGAGFWDLTAGGAKRGARPRALIDQAMAPVWESNNVWLIFSLVVLWTAFPRAFASIMSALFVPMSLAAAGIVLRGSAFVFRKPIKALTGRRLVGAAFAVSSVLTPFFLGAAFGAIASGRVRAGDPGGDPLSAWIGPTPMLIGALAVVCSASLAAVFLVFDARRARDHALEDYFRRRAIGSAAVTGLVAVAGLFVLSSDAPFVFHGLMREGLPFVLLSALCGVGVIALLARRKTRGTRGLAVGAVVALLAGWGVAQYPYLLPTSLTIEAGAGAHGTLIWVLVVLLLAAVTVVPALGLLFVLDQRDRLLDRDHRLGTHPR